MVKDGPRISNIEDSPIDDDESSQDTSGDAPWHGKALTNSPSTNATSVAAAPA